MSAIASYTFGFGILFGGVMGYVSKGSVPSLMAGGGCGGLLVVFEYYVRRHPEFKSALTLTQAGVSFAVAAFMLSSYLKSHAPRPLYIGATSLVASLCYISRAFDGKGIPSPLKRD